MLFVFAAHWHMAVFRYSNSDIAAFLYKAFMIASPSFIIISGIVLGLRFELRKADFMTLLPNMMDRGLYLLTIVHFCLLLPEYFYFRNWLVALDRIFITDVIGIGIIVGTIILPRLKLRVRAIIACLLFAISWVMTFQTFHWRVEFVKEALCGSDTYQMIYGFSILPWLSFFLVGTCFGERIGFLLKSQALKQLQHFLFKAGMIFTLSAPLIKTAYLLVKPHMSPRNVRTLWMLTDPLQKYPPSFVYFIFFAGIALLMLSFLFAYADRKAIKAYERFVGILGRNSLFVYVFQYVVYYAFLDYIRIYVTHWLPFSIAFFFISIWFIHRITKHFEAHGLKRLLTFKGLLQEITHSYAVMKAWSDTNRV